LPHRLALVLKPQLEKMKMLIKKKKKKMMMMMMMEILQLFLLLMMIQTLAADAPTPCESREHGIFKLLKPQLLLLLARTQVHPPTTTIAAKIRSLREKTQFKDHLRQFKGDEPKKSCGGGGARLKQHQHS
jgi:hypothetical protein